MNIETENKLIKKYNRSFDKYGLSDKSLGWHKGRSKLRFEILTSEWNLENSRILDFGCGFGGLFEFLKKKGIKVSYVGVDINENFINIAKNKHPTQDFRATNVLINEIDEEFDYAFISGAFNDLLDDNLGLVEKTLDVLNKCTKKGIAFNCISNKVEYQEDHVFYTDPALALDISYRFSNHIKLRNDYMPYEFSIFIRKDFHVVKGLVVYDDFLDYIERQS